MTILLEFSVRGCAVAQPRHKVTTVGGFGRAYVPASHGVHAWRAAIAAEARRAMRGRAPIEGPIRLSALIVFPRTGTIRKKGHEREGRAKKPDLDNLLKAVKDSLSPKRGGAAVWLDDSQVCQYGEVHKTLADAGWDPVRAQPIQEEPILKIQLTRPERYDWEAITEWSDGLPF